MSWDCTNNSIFRNRISRATLSASGPENLLLSRSIAETGRALGNHDFQLRGAVCAVSSWSSAIRTPMERILVSVESTLHIGGTTALNFHQGNH
jgi:hypothetical protein